MNKIITLSSIFTENKEELKAKLSNLNIPNDIDMIQRVVTDFMFSFFENDGAFRQSLTQSEDYILQAALQLLSTQQEITKEISKATNPIHVVQESGVSSSIKPSTAFIGTAVGAFSGKAIGSALPIFGTWGAVFGAIAGISVAVYMSSSKKEESTNVVTSSGIDAEMFVGIVKLVCESIDNLMETYRVQVSRIEDSYKHKEKPSLQTDYDVLLNQIANLSRVYSQNKESTSSKVSLAIEQVFVALENYGLTIIDGKIVND